MFTGTTGDTGRPTLKLLPEKRHLFRAMARKQDERSEKLEELGAEVVHGDLYKPDDLRSATAGVSFAYYAYPLGDGLVESNVLFAQAERENELEHIANMSHKQSRPHAWSKATLNHWLSEQVFGWPGLNVTHLRVTFLAEWLLYIATLIREGRYVVHFDPGSLFAPMPASEIARVIGKAICCEQVEVSTFLEPLGLEANTAFRSLFTSVKVDQQEGLLEGTDGIGTAIIGTPLMTIEEFIEENREAIV